MKKDIERVLIIRNPTQLENLKKKFSTKSQAEFYINQSAKNRELKKKGGRVKRSSLKIKAGPSPKIDPFSAIEKDHKLVLMAVDQIESKLKGLIDVKILDRQFLPNFIFSQREVVMAVGRDGLVANTAKYSKEIPLIGINPLPEKINGVLLPFQVSDAREIIERIKDNDYSTEKVTMAEAKTSDGQRLLAFNDFYIGANNHTSSKYSISYGNQKENQSSSGIIISTGAGSTGWLSSLFNMARGMASAFGNIANLGPELASKTLPWDSDDLIFAVREPYLSKNTGVSICSGIIKPSLPLTIESFMTGKGVIFSDGILTDFLQFNSGASVEIGIAPEKANLVLKKS